MQRVEIFHGKLHTHDIYSVQMTKCQKDKFDLPQSLLKDDNLNYLLIVWNGVAKGKESAQIANFRSCW